ncbi:MAG: DNA polymerase III, subunit gamma and tau, partial [Desulfovibrio sp.]|nr:DNA polymerase III, subunit gamma and tau [Desulfovibrio sp.]
VRDSMSLLDQTLALGGEELTVTATRQVLGLAGQELFGNLFDALHAQDCAAVAELCSQILQQGVDIGFFVRELAGNLRNLFLLRQGGDAMMPSLRLPADEAALWQSLAPRFSTAHLHAAWQMTLDSQRGIVHSPEPAAALELLLLNLALLPQLLPVGQLTPDHMPGHMPGQAPRQAPGQAPDQASGAAGPAQAASHTASPQPPAQTNGHAAPQPPHTGDEVPRNGSDAQAANTGRSPARPRDAATAPRPAADGDEAEGSDPATGGSPLNATVHNNPSGATAAHGNMADDSGMPPPYVENDAPWGDGADGSWGALTDDEDFDAAGPDLATAIPWDEPGADSAPAPKAAAAKTPAASPSHDWQNFYDFCVAGQAAERLTLAPYLLRGIGAQWKDGVLRLQPRTQTQLNQLEKQGKALYAALAAYGAGDTEVEIIAPKPHRPEAEIIEEFSRKEALQPCFDVLKASLKGCRPVD